MSKNGDARNYEQPTPFFGSKVSTCDWPPATAGLVQALGVSISRAATPGLRQGLRRHTEGRLRRPVVPRHEIGPKSLREGPERRPPNYWAVVGSMRRRAPARTVRCLCLKFASYGPEVITEVCRLMGRFSRLADVASAERYFSRWARRASATDGTLRSRWPKSPCQGCCSPRSCG